MLGTVIIDAYKKDEVMQIADALDDLCSPNDNYGWASAGIYCFWNYYTHEVFYIGLASDLSDRFKQHNGILPIRDECCKQKYINDYFKDHEKLGYTIFVQSSLAQPLTHRNKSKYEKFAKQQNSPISDMLSEHGKDDIKIVEGILIESYRRAHGVLPPWNKIGGDIEGQERVMTNNINIVRSFCNPEQYALNPIVSRSTLRELSNNPVYESYENFLHSVRMLMLMNGMNYVQALDVINRFDPYNCYNQIISSGYNKKVLQV